MDVVVRKQVKELKLGVKLIPCPSIMLVVTMRDAIIDLDLVTGLNFGQKFVFGDTI